MSANFGNGQIQPKEKLMNGGFDKNNYGKNDVFKNKNADDKD